MRSPIPRPSRTRASLQPTGRSTPPQSLWILSSRGYWRRDVRDDADSPSQRPSVAWYALRGAAKGRGSRSLRHDPELVIDRGLRAKDREQRVVDPGLSKEVGK